MRFDLWLTEGIQFRAECSDPSEFLELLCRAEVSISVFAPQEKGVYAFYAPASAEASVRKLGQRCGVVITEVKRRGLGHFFRRFRRRAYLLLLPLPFLLTFAFLSTRIWEIDVEGNACLTKAEILTELERIGVYPGVSGLKLDNPQIRSRMQEALKELIWCTVQVRGSRALVVVRERRQPPEILDESVHREIEAAGSGIVERLSVLEGKAAVKKGETVELGDSLITGILLDRQEEQRFVHAMGSVLARTSHEKTFSLPLKAAEKLTTGEITTGYALKVGDLRLNFHNESSISYACYDKIQNEKHIRLFGLELPLAVISCQYREYRLAEFCPDEQELIQTLRERLLLWLARTYPKAELLNAEFLPQKREDALAVTMVATCREDIAREREP